MWLNHHRSHFNLVYGQFCSFWYNRLCFILKAFCEGESVSSSSGVWQQLRQSLSNPLFLLSNSKITSGHRFVVFKCFQKEFRRKRFKKISFSRWNDKFTGSQCDNICLTPRISLKQSCSLYTVTTRLFWLSSPNIQQSAAHLPHSVPLTSYTVKPH